MLSFLFRLIRTFRNEHGVAPNVLYMNDFHYQKLHESLPEMPGYEQIARFLKLEIVISAEAVHPHAAWVDPAQRRSARG
ncbi:MAG TPA: hypothetical protein VGA00_09040 [Acidiferrobacterales bacterium]|jgi:hypothetical protein